MRSVDFLCLRKTQNYQNLEISRTILFTIHLQKKTYLCIASWRPFQVQVAQQEIPNIWNYIRDFQLSLITLQNRITKINQTPANSIQNKPSNYNPSSFFLTFLSLLNNSFIKHCEGFSYSKKVRVQRSFPNSLCTLWIDFLPQSMPNEIYNYRKPIKLKTPTEMCKLCKYRTTNRKDNKFMKDALYLQSFGRKNSHGHKQIEQRNENFIDHLIKNYANRLQKSNAMPNRKII